MSQNIAIWCVLIFSMLISSLALLSSLFTWKRLNSSSNNQKIYFPSSKTRSKLSKEPLAEATYKELDQRLKDIEYISHLTDRIRDRNVYRRTARLLKILSEFEKQLKSPDNTDEDREGLETEIRSLLNSIKGEIQLTHNHEGIIKELDFLESEKRKLRAKRKS